MSAEQLRLLFDIETDNLLDKCTKIHCIVTYDLDTKEVNTFRPGQIHLGLQFLSQASYLAGHNILDFDLRAIEKLHGITLRPAEICDTLVLSKLVFSDIKDRDFRNAARSTLPKFLIGSHSLKAWGYRLGSHKDDYADRCKEAGIDPWANFNEPMLDYCVQDVLLNVKLYEKAMATQPDPRSVELEMEVARIILEQEENGFPFDEQKASGLLATLVKRREELFAECARLFPDWWVALGEVTPEADRRCVSEFPGEWRLRGLGKNGKPLGMRRADLEQLQCTNLDEALDNSQWAMEQWFRNGKAVEYVPVYEETTAGAIYTKVKLQSFNPSSRHHVADRLQKLYGWKPADLTKDGKPKVDDDILSSLPFEPCPILAEFYMVEKRIGQLSEGNQAWLRRAVRSTVHGIADARIHGRVNTNGAVTGRATHHDPNLAQVPSLQNAKGPVPYGRECRELFRAVPGWLLCGADASGLELRCLGHFMSWFDGGAYIQAVLGGDVHWANVLALGLFPPGTVRDKHNKGHEEARANAKTFI